MATKHQIEIIQEIAGLALNITTQGEYHVFFQYWAHVGEFKVYIHLQDNDYQGNSCYLDGWGFSENTLYLSDDESCEVLTSIRYNLSKLLELDEDGIPV
jgi:hypothetical protein